MAVYAMIHSKNFGENFTIEQIKATHAKVKSGADFPKYVKDITLLGVKKYVTFVTDGHTDYFGKDEYKINSEPRYTSIKIVTNSNATNFKKLLKAHQQGKSDFLTFISQCAENGVEKWVVDTKNMTCAYYDLQGNEMLIELIPNPA